MRELNWWGKCVRVRQALSFPSPARFSVNRRSDTKGRRQLQQLGDRQRRVRSATAEADRGATTMAP